ncbi:MAG: ROK family protein [Proteobacteria bacterium]|nr:ROK family protein [Pseudomonadota bacterium]
MKLFGGIEAGGTKFVCAVGTGPGDVRAEIRFPTTNPDETIGKAIEFFTRQADAEPLTALGIASFGPVDPDPASPTFGYITSTPKPGWAHTEFAGAVARALGIPVGFDTDVNGAALAEYRWGAARDLHTFLYLTIGTGLGGGGMARGALLHGLIHPEVGHMRVPRHPDDEFPGMCPFHGDCLEGMANGPAIEKRWGIKGQDLPDDHPAWTIEAHYLAMGVVNLICALSPQRVVMGGGVMDKKHLFPMIRGNVLDLLAGYVQAPAILRDIDRYIVAPGLGNQAGVLGAIALAERAATDV